MVWAVEVVADLKQCEVCVSFMNGSCDLNSGSARNQWSSMRPSGRAAEAALVGWRGVSQIIQNEKGLHCV